MNPDRAKLIRLAYTNPSLRKSLLPLISKSASVALRCSSAPQIGSKLRIEDEGEAFGGERLYVASLDGEPATVIAAEDVSLKLGQELVLEALLDEPTESSFSGTVRVTLP